MHTLYQGQYLHLRQHDGWEYVSRTVRADVVIIIAVTEQQQLLLVEQYRVPVAARTIELPAGLVGDIPGQRDEALEQAAYRELEEETGYRATRLELVLQGPTSAGLSDERVSLFRAHGLQHIGAGGGDASEDILVHAIGLQALPQWLADRQADGQPLDPKIYAALYWLQQDYPALRSQ